MRERHNHYRTPTYYSWIAMRERCNNPNAISYPYYGGRGIQVCERWNTSFTNFLLDMGERPDGMSLDRKDNDGDYTLGNCVWSTAHRQAMNQRRRTDNSSGRKGVSFNNFNSKWKAYISCNGVRYHLGYFDTREGAIMARMKAEQDFDDKYDVTDPREPDLPEGDDDEI